MWTVGGISASGPGAPITYWAARDGIALSAHSAHDLRHKIEEEDESK
jgi:hypothetical protein